VLDVHPPHERVRGFVDFLVHILTITVGLLIALGLEAAVEALHHRHVRKEVEHDLRLELRDNEHALQVTRGALADEKKNLGVVMQYLAARSEDKPSDIHDLTVSFHAGTLSDASWRTATATGTLNLMNYDRVQLFASAYRDQELFSGVQIDTLDEYLQLQSYFQGGFDPDKMPPDEAKTAMADARRSLSHLEALDQIGQNLEKTYNKAAAE
jgi:hypothetical protein